MHFWLMSKDDSSSCAILCCLVKMLSFNHPWEFPNKANHVQHALCQVLKHGDKWPSDCESSCPRYYSQIEGLGLHVVYITRCVIRIKKHLHNWIEIINIKKKKKIFWGTIQKHGNSDSCKTEHKISRKYKCMHLIFSKSWTCWSISEGRKII